MWCVRRTALLFERSGSQSGEKTDHMHFLRLGLIRTDNEWRHTELGGELGGFFIQKYRFQNISHLEKFRPGWMDGWMVSVRVSIVDQNNVNWTPFLRGGRTF